MTLCIINEIDDVTRQIRVRGQARVRTPFALRKSRVKRVPIRRVH